MSGLGRVACCRSSHCGGFNSQIASLLGPMARTHSKSIQPIPRHGSSAAYSPHREMVRRRFSSSSTPQGTGVSMAANACWIPYRILTSVIRYVKQLWPIPWTRNLSQPMVQYGCQYGQKWYSMAVGGSTPTSFGGERMDDLQAGRDA